MTDYDRGYTQDLLEQKVSEQQATIADLQGQLKAAKAPRMYDCGSCAIGKGFEQRVAQLEGERDEATKGHTALLQAMANWIARLKPDHHPMYRRGVEEVIAATFNGVDLDSTPVLVSDWQKQQIRLATLQADHARVLGLLAQVTEIADMMLKGTECEHDVGLCSCEHRRIVKQAQRSLPAQPAQGGA